MSLGKFLLDDIVYRYKHPRHHIDSTILPRSRATGASLYPKGGQSSNSPLWLKGAGERSETGGSSKILHSHASNTSCGDEIDLYLKIDGGKIVDAKFSGQMCSIANYGAELLIDHIIGLSIEQAKQIKNADLLKTEQGASLLCNPVRLKCFELTQHAIAHLYPHVQQNAQKVDYTIDKGPTMC